MIRTTIGRDCGNTLSKRTFTPAACSRGICVWMEVSLRGLPCRYNAFQSFAPLDCVKPISGDTSDIRLFLRSNVISSVNPAKGATFDILLLLRDKDVRLAACCRPVRSRMSALFAVNVVNFSISGMVTVSPSGFPRVSVIFARRLASGIVTGALGRVAVAVNCTGCDICAAVTRTVVGPTVRPIVKRADALPVVSVATVVALSLPLPAVIANVTNTPANGRFRSSRTSTTNGIGNAALTTPCCVVPNICTSVVGVRGLNLTSMPLACIAEMWV